MKNKYSKEECQEIRKEIDKLWQRDVVDKLYELFPETTPELKDDLQSIAYQTSWVYNKMHNTSEFDKYEIEDEEDILDRQIKSFLDKYLPIN